MKCEVITLDNKKAGEIDLDESIFGLLPDVDNPTPLVRLNHVPGFDHTEVFAKLDAVAGRVLQI